MTDTQDQPLWQVMEGAFLEGRNPGFSDRHGYAAEIRAVADWIRAARHDYDEVLYGGIRADEMDSICALLLAEADRAERGES